MAITRSATTSGRPPLREASSSLRSFSIVASPGRCASGVSQGLPPNHMRSVLTGSLRRFCGGIGVSLCQSVILRSFRSLLLSVRCSCPFAAVQ